MLITASFPMIKLWDSILKNNENLDAEQVVNLVQQSLCAAGSAFQSLNTHHKKRFQGFLTKEFRSLADEQPNKSELTLSPWLYGLNLEEQIKSKLGSSTISRKVICREIPTSEGEAAAIDKGIVDLFKKGVIEFCLHTPWEFVSNVFMIPKKCIRNRPAIDMRVLNKFMKYIPFTTEDISQLKSVLKQGDLMTKLDLRGTYLTVSVDKKLKIYLRFAWRAVLYQFTCLPFLVSLLQAEFSPK